MEPGLSPAQKSLLIFAKDFKRKKRPDQTQNSPQQIERRSFPLA